MSYLFFDIFEPFYQERKEQAFARWVASGYRDVAAYAEFIRYYEALNKREPLG